MLKTRRIFCVNEETGGFTVSSNHLTVYLEQQHTKSQNIFNREISLIIESRLCIDVKLTKVPDYIS